MYMVAGTGTGEAIGHQVGQAHPSIASKNKMFVFTQPPRLPINGMRFGEVLTACTHVPLGCELVIGRPVKVYYVIDELVCT